MGNSSEEMPLAPGIKTAPVYMPPGAYPGDRTKIGKDYDKQEAMEGGETKVSPDPKPEAKHVESKVVKQSEKQDFRRADDGQTISFRTAEGEEPQQAEIGGAALPWALDQTARTMKVGDVKEVIGRGEHAFADDEEFTPGKEKRWPYFELLDITGDRQDKFSLPTDERIDKANDLRLQGNTMFKQNRLLRAMDYYERGSHFMDVLEAEDLGMAGAKPDKVAVEKNKRIWACQKPLLLNWALILIRQGRWKQAERKCTEVLMDIEKENVKALYRRGQCNIHLGNHEQARSDLRRAAELDTSIKAEVAKHMQTVDEMQRAADEKDKGMAKKLLSGVLKKSDQRSAQQPPKAQPMEDPSVKMMQTLHAQEKAADKDGIEEEAYCRQRESIYNQFLRGSTAPPPE